MEEYIPEDVMARLGKREVVRRMRRTERRLALKRGEVPPAASHTTFFANTVAHNILLRLETRPHTSKELGAGVRFGQQNVSAQLLRLLESGLIESDYSVYYITDKGHDILAHLGYDWSSDTVYHTDKGG